MRSIKTSLRHYTSHKLYTIINIIGLTAGITSMLVAVLYWNAERNFDDFHTKSSDLFRITTTLKERPDGLPQTTGGTGQVQGPAFKAAVPEIAQYVRLLGGDVYGDVRHEQKALTLQMIFADSNFFKMFNFPLIEGDPATALKDINSVVITEQTAMKFFNTTAAIGKFLNLDADPSAEKLNYKPMIVTGVAKTLPFNSSIQFDILLPFHFLQLSFDDHNWLNAYLGTYVQLTKNAGLNSVIQKFNQVYELKSKEQLDKAEFNPQIKYGLQSIHDIHLNSHLNNRGWHEGGTVNESKASYSNVFLGVAFIILLLASINFINISIAGSLNRAKEVGVRKISGSTRRSILLQFLIESTLLCVFAFILAILLTLILLPFLSQLTGLEIVKGNLFNVRQIASFVLVLLLIVTLSGLYPAYLLSGFKPVEVLYNRSKRVGLISLGKLMVVGQFAIAFFLIICTTVYYLQMKYIHTKNLGYDSAYVVRTNINGDRNYEEIKRLLKNEVAKYPYFEGISFGGEFGNNSNVTKIGEEKILASYQSIDEQYLNVMGIDLHSGNDISTVFSHDVLVNEAFVKASHLQNPIGTAIKLDLDYAADSLPYRIGGVVKDFHFRSLHHAITPMVLYQLPRHSGGIWLKINPIHISEALKTFERIYQSIIPGAVYHFDFLNDLTTREYKKELRWQTIISLAALLALLISCMGLFGLAHLNTRQRIREIGIRKVLGAAAENIVNLFVRDFIKLVLSGIIIATVIAIYFTNHWLLNFVFKVEIHWWWYAISAMGVLFIALLTVGSQAFKAGSSNPVECIRN